MIEGETNAELFSFPVRVRRRRLIPLHAASSKCQRSYAAVEKREN